VLWKKQPTRTNTDKEILCWPRYRFGAVVRREIQKKREKNVLTHASKCAFALHAGSTKEIACLARSDLLNAGMSIRQTPVHLATSNAPAMPIGLWIR